MRARNARIIANTRQHYPIKSNILLKHTSTRSCVDIMIIVGTLSTIVALICFVPYFTGSSLSESILYGQQMLTTVAMKIADPFINPQSECKHIPIHTDDSSTNVIYLNNFPENMSVEDIIKKRTEPIENIPICPNANITNFNQYTDILSKLPENLIYYTNRCQINAINRFNRQFGGLLSGDPLKPHHSTQIGFLHVYKAGGTTVRDTMNNILPGQSRVIWNKYRGHLREFMSHLFMFSHVRDPITRTVSSFFELHRRNETVVSRNDLVGIDSFRYMLSMMKSRMDCSLGNKTKKQKMEENNIGAIFSNMHIMPQMYFLTEHANPWKTWPVNYIGNMSDLINSTFEILYHFYYNNTDYLKVNKKHEYLSKEMAFKHFNSKYHFGRDRHLKLYIDGGERKAVVKGQTIMRYQIEVNELSDNDIRQICEIYWMDYICIPFPIPTPCNLTDLLLKHYGDDVVYKDCWEYNTDNWDPYFVKQYSSKGFNPLDYNSAARKWAKQII